MLTKMNKGLLGLFGVQLVLAVIVLSTRGAESVSYKQEPVLAGFDPAAVTRLQIFADGGAKPAIDLVKRDAWVLASHFDYPAEAPKVTAALTPLGKMTAGEPIGLSASRHRQMKVADDAFDRKLVITAGGKDITLFIGVTKNRRTAVRRAGEEIVLGASGVTASSISSGPRDWVARSYSEIPRDDITKILIQRGTASTELDRSGPAGTTGSGSGSGSGSDGVGSGAAAAPPSWRLAFDGAPLVLATGEKVDDFAINTVISEIASIEAMPADPAKDVSKPTATITVTRKAGTTITFDVVADGDNLYVKQRGANRATTIDKMRMAQVMKLDRGQLIQKPDPAPGPGAGSGSGAPIVPPPSGRPKRP